MEPSSIDCARRPLSLEISALISVDVLSFTLRSATKALNFSSSVLSTRSESQIGGTFHNILANELLWFVANGSKRRTVNLTSLRSSSIRRYQALRRAIAALSA